MGRVIEGRFPMGPRTFSVEVAYATGQREHQEFNSLAPLQAEIGDLGKVRRWV